MQAESAVAFPQLPEQTIHASQRRKANSMTGQRIVAVRLVIKMCENVESKLKVFELTCSVFLKSGNWQTLI